MGVRRPRPRCFSASRIRRVASKPPTSGICTSIRTRSKVPAPQACTASRPLAARVASWPARLRASMASCWFTRLSSATRMRSWRSAGARRAAGRFGSRRRGGARLQSRRPSAWRTARRRSASCTGLVTSAADLPARRSAQASPGAPTGRRMTTHRPDRQTRRSRTRLKSSSPPPPARAMSTTSSPNGRPRGGATRWRRAPRWRRVAVAVTKPQARQQLAHDLQLAAVVAHDQRVEPGGEAGRGGRPGVGAPPRSGR